MTGVKYAKAYLKGKISSPLNMHLELRDLRRHDRGHEHEGTGGCQRWIEVQALLSPLGNLQGPQFQVQKMPPKYCPCQGIRYSVSPIFLDPSLHELSVSLGQEAFLVSFVWEIDQDEPRCYGDDLYGQPLNNLLRISFLHHLRTHQLTNIHCQPLRPPRPSIRESAYASIFENPPTFTENK